MHNTLKLSGLTSQFRTVVNSIYLTRKIFQWKVLCVYAYGLIKFHVTVCNSVSEGALVCIANIFLLAAILFCVMREISFENCYAFFKCILFRVNLSGSATAPM